MKVFLPYKMAMPKSLNILDKSHWSNNHRDVWQHLSQATSVRTCHSSKYFHHFVQNEKLISLLLPERLYIAHILNEHLVPAPLCTENMLTYILVMEKKPINQIAKNEEEVWQKLRNTIPLDLHAG